MYYILLACIALVDLLTPALPYLTTSAKLPVHVEHLSERMGLFTILYLGELVPFGFGCWSCACDSMSIIQHVCSRRQCSTACCRSSAVNIRLAIHTPLDCQANS
jgi:hypothetical protein